jgi:ABC-type transport system substrate-binding protein
LLVNFSDDPSPFFKITLLTPDGWNWQRIEYAKMIAEELPKIGIGIKYHDIAESSSYYSRLNGYTNTYDEGGYDVVFVGFGEDLYELDKGYQYRFGSKGNTTGWNIYNYQNETMDDLYEKHFSFLTPEERNNTVKSMQNILYQDLPAITILNYQDLFIHNQNWDLSQNELQALFNSMYDSSAFKSGWEHMGFGSENTLIIHKWFFNFFSIFWEGVYYNSAKTPLQDLMFQGLYDRNIDNPSNWEPLLAKSMPVWSNENKIATIQLKENVSFADGMNFTAHDVVNSYRMRLTASNHPAQYDLLTDLLVSNSSITAPDNYTVKFELSESYPFAMNLFSMSIAPMHTWGNYTDPAVKSKYGGSYIWDMTMVNQTIHSGSSQLGYGTGPYVLDGIESADTALDDITTFSNITFTKNQNYWRGPVKTQNIEFSWFGTDSSKYPDYIKNNKTHLILTTDVNNITAEHVKSGGFSYEIVTEGGTQDLAINLKHSVIGTGVDTPLGQTNSLRASEAARYVRQAISHVIPREKIIDELFSGSALPGTTPIPATTIGFDESLAPYEYNIGKAKELMEKAGYVYPVSTPTTTISIPTTTTTPPQEPEEGGLSILTYFAGILALGTAMISVRKRKKLSR